MNRPKRRGFTLVEILCVMILLAAIGTILALMLTETIRVERAEAAGFDRMLQRNALADQFRADVNRAAKMLPAWGGFQSGADTLILEQNADRRVVYRWHDNLLTRYLFEGDNETERVMPVGNQTRVQFAAADSKLVRLRLITLHQGKVMPGQTVEIAAALAGDMP